MPDPGEASARLANRLLQDQDWARERLTPFAGRVVSWSVGPVHAASRVTAEGTFEDVAADAVPDLALTISPLSVPPLLANPARWNEFVRETGDAELGGVLKDLAQTLPWFVEASLARALGPLAGQRVADAGRRLLGFPEYAFERMTESVVSYARDEAELLARGDAMRRFVERVDDAAARVAALEARIESLATELQART
jgi:ubiquinone biosynthesis accessory factor UbiJ